MCGICGIYGVEDKELIKKMCKTIQHRGPDEEGEYFDKNISLGIRRLSIIDLKTGSQPIHNEEESIWVILNGEIYNYIEIKKDLTEKGHKFYTKSDTETIVHLYEEYDENFLSFLRGMFAIAIYDSQKEKLLLARDRIGIKPLYYAFFKDSLCFASEAKAILLHPEMKRVIDKSALNYYLKYRYVPAPLTIFKGIKKLQPGYILTIEKNCYKINEYWDISFKEKMEIDENKLAKKIYDKLEETIDKWSISDVPIGLLLSGGLDSATLLAFLSKKKEKIKTFTACMEVGQGKEEMKRARFVTEKFSAELNDCVITDKEYISNLAKCIWHLDEPLADPSTVPLYLVSNIAKKNVKVLLSGEGGDEIFCGYGRHIAESFFPIYSNFPNSSKIIASKVLEKFEKLDSIRRAARYLCIQDGLERWIASQTIFSDEERKEIIQMNYEDCKKIPEEYYRKSSSLLPLDKMCYLDIKIWLPDDLLARKDKVTMAASVEGRTPFLDHELLELSSAIDPALKVKFFKGKYIFKKAIKELIPKRILNGKKLGFPVPIVEWMNGEMKDIFIQILLDKRTKERGYLKGIEKIADKIDGVRNVMKAFLIVNFELWCRVFIDNSSLELNKII
ncbi:MAG: asparagine synthase (glutamine-hydrolyzing) [Candidatus Thermoplasmatota archaeon]